MTTLIQMFTKRPLNTVGPRYSRGVTFQEYSANTKNCEKQGITSRPFYELIAI